MRDKRKQKLRTLLGPKLHDEILAEFLSILETRRGEVRVDYLLANVLSKYVGPDTDPPESRRAAAIEKWLSQEQRNRKTNMRMYGVEADFGWPLAKSPYCLSATRYAGDADEDERRTVTSEVIISEARELIQKVIGADPPEFDQIMGGFTGGASTRYTRDTGNVARKFMGQADVTIEALPYVMPLRLGCHGWLQHLDAPARDAEEVYGNILFTVPKSTTIDRVAAKEPDLNMFAQTAYGDHITRRLKRFGIDLKDQSINRGLARLGSVDGKLATIDLSSASDSVSTSLVARLLPPGWFVVLNALRSQRTLIDGEWHENEMFSSMGNGFTFPLETLIFFGIAWALARLLGIRGRISVYGDDIIVPSKLAPMLYQTFLFFGFRVNPQKSFWTGRTRESCGGHYHGGADITPFFIKEPIASVDRLIHFLNRLRQWCGLATGGHFCDPDFQELWSKYAKLVDSRLYGGDDYGDPSRLVTRHKPRMKLVKLTFKPDRLIDELQVGLYLQTLCDLSRSRGVVSPAVYFPPRPIGAKPRPGSGMRSRQTLTDAVSWAKSTRFESEGATLSVETNEWVMRKVEAKPTKLVKPIRRSSSRSFAVWFNSNGDPL